MSGKPFDREVINTRERPLSSDVNEFGSYADQALRETIYNLFGSRISISLDGVRAQPPVGAAAFIGAAFKARGLSGTMQVSLDPGLGFFNDATPTTSVGGISGVDDIELIKPLSLTANEIINIPAADPTNPRWDIIEVQFDRRLTDATSRDIFNPSAAAFQPGVVNKTLTYNQNGRSTVNGVGSINYKTGVAAAIPQVPATDAGYSPIARVYVPANTSALGATSFLDFRRMLFPGGVLRVAGSILVSPSAVSMGTLQAPPGVEVQPTILNANPPVVGLLVKAGDTGQYRFDDPVNLGRGSFMTQAVVSNGFSAGSNFTTEIIGTTGGIGGAPAGWGALQPVLSCSVGNVSPSAVGAVSFDMVAQTF